MSYDIYLKDPVTEKIAEVPGHLMRDETNFMESLGLTVFQYLRK